MFCPHCGKENENQLDTCSACGARLAVQSSLDVPVEEGAPPSPPPGATPVSPPAGNAAPGGRLVGTRRVAGLGDRLIALILDSVMLMAVFAIVGTLVASLTGGQVKGGFSMEGLPAFATIGLTMLLGFLYFWFLEGLIGGTLGKRIMGLQIRGINDDRCTLKQSLIRNLLRVVDGLAIYLVGFFIALFSKFRQRLGDHAAKTVVVEASPGTALRVVFVVVWLAIIVAGLWGAYIIHSHIPG